MNSSPKPPLTSEQPPPSVALMRMVDFRIPLVWLLSGFVAAVGILTSMYFQIERMRETLQDLQITVKAGNVASGSLTSELALLKYRVDALEAAERREKQAGK